MMDFALDVGAVLTLVVLVALALFIFLEENSLIWISLSVFGVIWFIGSLTTMHLVGMTQGAVVFAIGWARYLASK